MPFPVRRVVSFNCLLSLVRDDLDVVQKHLARHISSLGAKGEDASEAALQIFLCVLMVLVLLEAFNWAGQYFSPACIYN